MVHQSSARVVVTLLMLAGCLPAAAQFSIARPKPASIRQVSATNPSLAAARNSLLPQIRVTIRYVMVDGSTRKKIYASLARESILTESQLPESPRSTGHSADSASSEPLALSEAVVASSEHQFRAPSRVTTSVLNSSQSKEIIAIAAANELSEVSDAPAVILIDGKEAEMNDVVQHPMVVDVQASHELVRPTVNVFEEGIRLRMKASLGGHNTAQDGILLSCEVSTSQTLTVKSHQIFGVEEEPVTVQVPIHLITSSIASARVAAGHSLLIDPHHSRESNVARQRGVPMLTKLPYVGRSFMNVSSEPVDRWMIVLLEPSLVEPTKTNR